MTDYATSVRTADSMTFDLIASRALTVLQLPAPVIASLTGIDTTDAAALIDGSHHLDETHPGRSELIGVVELYRWLLLRSGDELAVRRWLHTPHPALGAVPAELVASPSGLRLVLAHLRAHRD